MLAFLTIGWGRVGTGLIPASLVLAGIFSTGQGGRIPALGSTTQALRNAEVRHGIRSYLNWNLPAQLSG